MFGFFEEKIPFWRETNRRETPFLESDVVAYLTVSAIIRKIAEGEAQKKLHPCA